MCYLKPNSSWVCFMHMMNCQTIIVNWHKFVGEAFQKNFSTKENQIILHEKFSTATPC